MDSSVVSFLTVGVIGVNRLAMLVLVAIVKLLWMPIAFVRRKQSLFFVEIWV